MDFCGLESHLGEYLIGFGILIKFPSQRKKIFKSVQKQRNYALIKKKQGNWTFVVREPFEGKYNIGIGIPIKFPSQSKKNIEFGPESTKLCFNQKCQNRHV